MSAFDRGLRVVLRAEGGWYDGTGPHDKNPTNFGITQRTYDRWRKTAGQKTRTVKSIEAEELGSIYQVMYWTKGKCEKLAERSEAIAIIHFDACVNHGVASPNSDESAGAVELLQRAVGVEDDGIFGPKTWGAFCELLADDGEVALANRYFKSREAQYRHLARKAPKTLGLNLEGWLVRLRKLREFLGIPA